MNQNPFELVKTSDRSKARRGRLHTAHGTIETPIFMPVGTLASVKGLSSRDLREMQAQIILANTYHLYLRPGTKLVAKMGGVQKFMGWNGPMLTDSGGFQVWSLKDLRHITEEGVEFRSHLDGSHHLFTPESVMKAQREIGADIIMAFDECTPYPSTVEEASHSLDYTLAWTKRAKDWLEKNPPVHDYPQFFFGIVQGGMHKELRQKSIDALKEIAPDGYAMGGLSVGEPVETMYEIADFCTNSLPADRARYVMGVGTPWNLLSLIARGGAAGIKLMDLPAGARVGTGSIRRVVQLKALRPDLEYVPIRGNIQTRLGKLAKLDAVVLAAAGLKRMGLADQVTEYFSTEQILPASGQGILAIETLCSPSDELVSQLARVNDAESYAIAVAEMAYLKALNVGCQFPVASFAEFSDAGTLALRGIYWDESSKRLLRAQVSQSLDARAADSVAQARAAGFALAQKIREQL